MEKIWKWKGRERGGPGLTCENEEELSVVIEKCCFLALLANQLQVDQTFYLHQSAFLYLHNSPSSSSKFQKTEEKKKKKRFNIIKNKFNY